MSEQLDRKYASHRVGVTHRLDEGEHRSWADLRREHFLNNHARARANGRSRVSGRLQEYSNRVVGWRLDVRQGSEGQRPDRFVRVAAKGLDESRRCSWTEASKCFE